MDRDLDRPLLLSVIFLLGLGIVQVYSSSFIFAIESFDDGLFFVKKQALFVGLATVVLVITAFMPIKWLERLGLTIWLAALVGLVLTLVPGVGVKVGGATRWLNVGGGIRFEPSEMLKYTFPVLLAWLIERTQNKQDAPFARILLHLLALSPVVILLRQPDFGSVAIVSVVAFAIYFSQELSWRYVIAAFAGITLSFYFLIVQVDYRMARVKSFLDPWSDPAQKGFQVIQSMLGYYSGGLTGVGLGQGQGKLFFLPEAHTDFTLSVLGEELGFIGITSVFVIFGYIIFRGLQISAQSKNLKWQIIALGVTMMFAITTLVNAGVTLGILPTKGLGLPFLSYGGSALLATCFGLGLLFNIDRQNRIEKRRTFIQIK